MRVRLFILPLCLAVIGSLSCTESSFEPMVEQLFEVDQTVGHAFHGELFRPSIGNVGPGNLLYLLALGDDVIKRYTYDGVPVDEWDGGGSFGSFRAMDIAPDGTVVVAERSQVVVLDDSGNLVRSWEAPLNLTITDLMVTPGGEVVVVAGGRILVFLLTGEYQGEWSVPGDGTVRGISTSPDGNPLLIFTGSLREFTVSGESIRDWPAYHPIDAVSDGDSGLFVIDVLGRARHLDFQGNVIAEWWKDADENQYLHGPTSITRDSGGDLHIVDYSLYRVARFSGTGEARGFWADDPEPDGSLVWVGPGHIDKAGSHHIMERRLSRIMTYAPSGEFVSAWGERGHQAGMWVWAEDFVLGPDGSFYILERNRIQRFSPSGEYELGWKTPGASYNLAIDADGNLYVTEFMVVVKYGPDGTRLEDFEGFVRPDGITVAGGYVYVVELSGKEVRVLNTEGEEQRRWKLINQADRSRLDIAVDSRGYVYVSDYWPGQIEIYDPNGEHLTTIAGNWIGRMQPGGIAVDSADRLLIPDTWNRELKIFKQIPGTVLE